MKFSELEMHPDLRRGIDEAGYIDCMPVQEQVYPHAFAGEDIYAQSQTGTGKTAAFLVSIFQRMMTEDDWRHRKALILAPTRELAAQIEEEAEKLGKYLPIKMASFFGGVSYGPQVDALRNGAQMLVGTPGRIIDLVQQGKMMLGDVGFLVVDEADRMFDMGFVDDLRKLLRYLPSAERRQTYLFSATLNFRVKNLAWEYMHEPKEIVIAAENVTVDMVTQELYHVGAHEKMRVLLGILDREKPKSALIFCNQKFMVEEVARRLGINGVECEFIMGDLPQSQRLKIIDNLKAGRLEILVATDVAARGLDVEALDLVVNYDVPLDAESYVHRIGRTARAGKAGKAVTLACEKFVYGLPAVEKYIEMKLPVFPVTEELLKDDKSAELRFGHSRDRGREAGSRDRHRTAGERGPRREHERSRPGATRQRSERPERPGEARAGELGRDEPRIQGARPRGADARGPREDRGQREDRGRRDGRGRGNAPAGTPRVAFVDAAGDNPYSVSADERMKRYKEKYAGPDAEAGKQGAPGAEGGSGRGKTAGGDRNRRGGEGRRDRRGPRTEGARDGREREDAKAAGGRDAPRDGTSRRDGRPQGQGRGQGQGQGRNDGRGTRQDARVGSPEGAQRKRNAPARQGDSRNQARKPSAAAAKPAATPRTGLVGKLLGALGLGKKKGRD
ncbi:MAG: DEAD/DEAH box helicase [Spirochaetales bacterium]|nr:DEAD/DEAH box helicase [Spirochaetales bacterium]